MVIRDSPEIAIREDAPAQDRGPDVGGKSAVCHIKF
jgi:hypothetical protein